MGPFEAISNRDRAKKQLLDHMASSISTDTQSVRDTDAVSHVGEANRLLQEYLKTMRDTVLCIATRTRILTRVW
jgi:hypothetical protein